MVPVRGAQECCGGDATLDALSTTKKREKKDHRSQKEAAVSVESDPLSSSKSDYDATVESAETRDF